MKLYRLHRVQNLPLSLKDAWDFFCTPTNLPEITPPELEMTITSGPPEHMYAGMILTYTVRPLLRFRIRWVSEITQVREPWFFVDEQRLGPYRFWHHQHLFREIEGGVEMQDIIHYALPFGLLGRMMHRLKVRRQLEGIFDYRKKVLIQKFGVLYDGPV